MKRYIKCAQDASHYLGVISDNESARSRGQYGNNYFTVEVESMTDNDAVLQIYHQVYDEFAASGDDLYEFNSDPGAGFPIIIAIQNTDSGKYIEKEYPEMLSYARKVLNLSDKRGPRTSDYIRTKDDVVSDVLDRLDSNITSLFSDVEVVLQPDDAPKYIAVVLEILGTGDNYYRLRGPAATAYQDWEDELRFVSNNAKRVIYRLNNDEYENYIDTFCNKINRSIPTRPMKFDKEKLTSEYENWVETNSWDERIWKQYHGDDFESFLRYKKIVKL